MDEMKPGERPDTVHLKNLPIEWFADRSAPKSDPRPSESLFRKAFERFGKVRRVDVPVCDPHRKQMKDHMTGISKFSFDSDQHFEGYVQFVEYAGFVRAMDALRGAKLARKEDDGTGRAVAIQVDFDRTKHLSDASIKRRSIVRERLVARQKAREEKEKEELSKKKKKEEAERREKDRSEREKLTHTQEREQRRKAKQLAKLKEKEASEINSKIAREQKKLLRTQRKLQSIRLLEELFERLQVKHKSGIALKEQDATDVRDCNRENKKELRKLEKALLYESKEKLSRDKLVSKYKNAQEQELEDQRMKLQKALEGKIVLRSVLDTGKRKIRSSSSISSLSSGSDIPEYIEKDIKLEKHLTPDKDLFIKKEPNEAMTSSYHAQLSHYNYSSYAPYLNQNYNYHQPLASGYYPRPGYFPAQEHGYQSRGRGYSRRPRGNHYGLRGYRNIPRIPYFDGSDSTQAYYKYFKNLTDGTSGDYDNRNRSYSRSRSRSRRRSYSRSRSRSSRSRSRSRSRRHSSSRRRSRYSRSRSYDSRSRSRSRNRRSRTRSRNRRSRSRSRSNHSKRSHRTRSKSNNRSHSRSRNKSKSDSKSRLKSRSKSQSKAKSKSKSRSLSKHSTESKSKYKRLNSDTKQPTDFIPRSVRENSKKETSQNDVHKSGDDKSTSEVKNTKESEDSNRKNRSNSWSPVAD